MNESNKSCIFAMKSLVNTRKRDYNILAQTSANLYRGDKRAF